MMNSCAEDIKDMLVAESSLALTYGEDLFIGKEPVSPINCVTVYDTSGFAPQLTLQGRNDNYYYPSVQIRVRNTKYTTGWDVVQDIADALHGRHSETWNGTLYTMIRTSSGPALLDWDERGRVHFVVNFFIQRR